MTWKCDDCGRQFEGAVYYSTEEGALCPDDAGPFLVPDDEDDPRRFTVVARAAIEEVIETYQQSGNTFDGVIDVGPALQQLGTLIGLDIRSEVIRQYEETNANDS